MRQHRAVLAAAVVVLGSAVAMSGSAAAISVSAPTSALGRGLSTSVERATTELDATLEPATAELDAALEPATAELGEAVYRAAANVRAHARASGFGAGQALSARDVIIDSDGTEHVRFDRTYQGLPVLAGDVVVHSAKAGPLKGLDRASNARIELASVRPTVSAPDAADIAAAQQTAGDAATSAPTLAVDALSSPRLVWDVLVTGVTADQTPSELHVIVDATSGAVLRQWEGVHNAEGTGKGFFNRAVSLGTDVISSGYRLRDATRGAQLTCDMYNSTGWCYYIDDADNHWGDGTLSNRQSTAVDAQYGAATTWDYFKRVHGRNGIANDGKPAHSRVHYGYKYNNAFWSDACFCMTYGDGDGTTFNPFASLDVAGHEMAHGLTRRTANLTYSGESGALNEATSDIFASMVEHYAASPDDAPDYEIGEKLYRSGTRSLRYMYYPSKDGVSKDCWYPGIGSIDVHYSSGPANHFFYLLAQGSNAAPASPICWNAAGVRWVGGIGRFAAEKIWYRALTVYMTSSTNYAGARMATLRAASDLYGAGSTQYASVAAAWSAVNVG